MSVFFACCYHAARCLELNLEVNTSSRTDFEVVGVTGYMYRYIFLLFALSCFSHLTRVHQSRLVSNSIGSRSTLQSKKLIMKVLFVSLVLACTVLQFMVLGFGGLLGSPKQSHYVSRSCSSLQMGFFDNFQVKMEY